MACRLFEHGQIQVRWYLGGSLSCPVNLMVPDFGRVMNQAIMISEATGSQTRAQAARLEPAGGAARSPGSRSQCPSSRISIHHPQCVRRSRRSCRAVVLSAVCKRHLMSRLFAPHSAARRTPRVRSGPSEARRHLPLLPTAPALPFDARNGSGAPRTPVAHAGPYGAKARMEPAGGGDRSASIRTDSESAACACAVPVAVFHGRAAGQAPLAVSRARVRCSLDGPRCWCQVACVACCDRALS